MKINQPAPTNFSGYESRTTNVHTSGTYKIGQILQATVLAHSNHGQVSLNLGKAEITASTNITLQKNTHLSLKVMQLQPQLLLQVMSSNNPLQEALKNMLPIQSSLAPLLAELAQKALSKENYSNQPHLRTAANLLFAAIPGRNDIKQADGLRQAIMQSGLFLEAKLASPTVASSFGVSTDIKSLLLRYLNALTKTHGKASNKESLLLQSGVLQQSNEIPPPLRDRLPINLPRVRYKDSSSAQGIELDNSVLLKKTQGALARLGLLQVATVENLENGHIKWLLEIPVRHDNAAETVSLTIEKEQEKSPREEPNKAAWAVNLSFNLPHLGALQSRLSMDKLGLSTTFWSESRQILSVIDNRLAELRANFEQQGLQTHKLSCVAGQQTSARSTQHDNPLIDYQI